jgi:hypothetical protein
MAYFAAGWFHNGVFYSNRLASGIEMVKYTKKPEDALFFFRASARNLDYRIIGARIIGAGGNLLTYSCSQFDAGRNPVPVIYHPIRRERQLKSEQDDW